MSFFFGTYSEGFVADSKDKEEYDSSFKFPNQNVTVSKSDGVELDMYDLNFGVEMPVYDVTKYFTELKELSMEIFKIFDYKKAGSPVTDDTLKQIIPIVKKLLFVIQNIYDVFKAYTYTDNDINVYMIVTILSTLESQIKLINKYISENESKISSKKNATILHQTKTDVTEIIKSTYAAAGAVAIASSDDTKIATEPKVKTIYTAIPVFSLNSEVEAGNFIDAVRSEVFKEITSITDNDKLYAAILKKSEYLDFYCNNKINVKLLFDSKKIKVGDSGPGVPGRTSCLLSRYKMKGAEESNDSMQSDVDSSSAKTNFEELIAKLTEASDVGGLNPQDKIIVDEIIKKANEVTQAKDAVEYNNKKDELRTAIVKITNFMTDPNPQGMAPSESVDVDVDDDSPVNPADAPAADTTITTITINGTECKTNDEVKAAFDKIIGIDTAKLVTDPITPSRLEKLATEYYEFNIRESRKKDTSTSGILISTQAKIQEAIGDLQVTISTPTATEYHNKFEKDDVFVDMNKDDSGLVCGLPEKPKKYVFEFEFDLSEFVFDLNLGNVSTESSGSSGSPNKNILLLHKGSWISIVFKNVHIPLKQTFGTFESEEDAYTKFDGKIKEDALMLMLSINNTDYPKPKSAGVLPHAQPDMSPFKDLFFMKTNPIIFGTKNDSIIEFQYVKLTGEKIKSQHKEPGVLKTLTQSVIQGVQNIHQDHTKAADLAARKQLFIQKTRETVNAFRRTCIDKITGKVDSVKSNQYIKSLYISYIDANQLKNIFGLTGKMPRLIFALTDSLIPNDTNVENSMLLIVRALAGDDSIKSWSEQSNFSPIPVPVPVQGGGAAITLDNINKATLIIKDMMNLLTNKQFMAPNVSSTFTNGLENAEQRLQMNMENPDAIEITVPPPPADSTPESAMGASAYASSSSPRNKITGMFGNLFGKKSSSSSASSSSSYSDGTNMETCGNTASVACNGENLIVTITLNASDLLNQCGITHESILNIASNTPVMSNIPGQLVSTNQDHGKTYIDHANTLPPSEAEAYIKGLTPNHFSYITEAHIKALKPELQPIFRVAKEKAMAGAGAAKVVEAQNVTTKTTNNLSVSPTSISDLKVGEIKQLNISGGNNKSITYASNDETVATVDANSGLVTGVAPGNTTIEITQAENDTMEATKLTVSVNVVAEITTPIKELTTNTLSFTTPIPSDIITLDIAKDSKRNTYDLGTTNVPKSDAGSNGAFTYESSNPKVATVEKDSGLVTGVAEGDAIITITQAATSVFAEGTLKVNVKVVDSSTKPPPNPDKSEEEQKFNELKAQYEEIEKTREKLKTKIEEIINKIKSITMSPDEIANERRYNELKAQYEAVTKTAEELTKKSQEIIDKINTLIPEELL